MQHPKMCTISILFIDLNKREKKKNLLSLTNFRKCSCSHELMIRTHVFPLGRYHLKPPNNRLRPHICTSHDPTSAPAFANKPGPAPLSLPSWGRNVNPADSFTLNKHRSPPRRGGFLALSQPASRVPEMGPGPQWLISNRQHACTLCVYVRAAGGMRRGLRTFASVRKHARPNPSQCVCSSRG